MFCVIVAKTEQYPLFIEYRHIKTKRNVWYGKLSVINFKFIIINSQIIIKEPIGSRINLF